jgi:hypothetical protein
MPQEFYGIGRAIADVADSFDQEIGRYNAMPPLRKNQYRAVCLPFSNSSA